jgi:hypothetical protein
MMLKQAGICGALVLALATNANADESRQSLEDAWFTGPIVAAGAGTLPQGHVLIEPYLYDVITRGRYDDNGDYRDTDTRHSFGSLTYLLYGLTDRLTIGAIPTFGFTDAENGVDSSKIGIGDLTLQAQYKLTQFDAARHVPTLSVVLQESLPTGKYDRLGARPNDGFGSGAFATTLGVYSQYYFWLPNGRILRTRLNVAYTLPESADVTDTSVYGTPTAFRGHATPGDTLAINTSFEWSLTREWVLALDAVYSHDAATRVRGIDRTQQTRFDARSASSWRFALAPAIEYNWNSQIGVIVGARWFAAGRNTGASVTPVMAINIVY